MAATNAFCAVMMSSTTSAHRLASRRGPGSRVFRRSGEVPEVESVRGILDVLTCDERKFPRDALKCSRFLPGCGVPRPGIRSCRAQKSIGGYAVLVACGRETPKRVSEIPLSAISAIHLPRPAVWQASWSSSKRWQRSAATMAPTAAMPATIRAATPRSVFTALPS